MTKRKAQGALEYLITYGWAILIIVIIGGALFALGVFNPSSWVSNKRATGFASIQVKDWKVTSPGGLFLVLGNKLGDTITIEGVNMTTAGALTPCFSNYAFSLLPLNATNTLSVDESGKTIPASGAMTGTYGSAPDTCGNAGLGKTYTLTVQIQYTTPTGVSHIDTGTITGKVES
jgi:hypothetical protein